MERNRTVVLWLLWIVGTLVAGGVLAGTMYIGGPRHLLLIGKTTSAHHQIELACGACHTAGFLPEAKKADKAMNKACLSCHEDELKLSNDSHPIKKFRDPRNADRLAKLDARLCATCHVEHADEITHVGAVTLPMDYCSACHQEVFENRPSHAGYGFDTCASAGCHNYHDNTALYEDFLVKHAGQPDMALRPVAEFAAMSRAEPAVVAALRADDPVAALKSFLAGRDAGAGDAEIGHKAVAALETVLSRDDALAPAAHLDAAAIDAWAGSGHARAGINCAGCHAPGQTEATDLAALAQSWIERPGQDVCAGCHKPQGRSFSEGKHGMRLHPELPGPRKEPKNPALQWAAPLFQDTPLAPMPVSEARVPVRREAHALTLGTCNACHAPHEVDLKVAAVEACTGCHADTHTQAYATSPHGVLWRKELAGAAAPGTGVTCADCHMPKQKGRGSVPFVTTHNQNAYLRPNEKMIRPVCLSCHGLEFSIDALADPDLVESNFNGRPTRHVESVDWALKRAR